MSLSYAVLVVIVVDLLATSGDITLSWTSPIYPKLYSNDSSINPLGRPITENEDAWLGSLLNVGAVIGPLPFGFVGEHFGRKFGLLSIGIPHIISFSVLAFASNIHLIYFARFLAGLAMGGGYTLLPIYIAEISESKNRGAMSQSLNIFWAIGNFIPYAIGPFISIKWFNLVLAIIPVSFFVLFLTLGIESPYYLVQKNNIEEAETTLMLLRSKTKEDVQDELNYIKKYLRSSEDGRLMDIIRDSTLRKSLLICLMLICTQELSGFCAVTYHMQSIFDAAGSKIGADISALIVGLGILVSSFAAPFLVDKCGRRYLLIISCFGMCFADALIGIFFYQHDSTNIDTKPIQWIPMFSLIFYILSFNFGICTVPWTLVSELFPSKFGQVSSTTASSACWSVSFITTTYFNDMNDLMGRSGTFWTFAIFCMIAGVLSIIFVPETKGKGFIEIQEMLNPKLKRDYANNYDEFVLEKPDIR